MEEIKICTSCKQELPATTDYFYGVSGVRPIDGQSKGLRSKCKKCMIKEHGENGKRRRQLMEDGTYERLFNKSDGVCFICRKPSPTGSLSIDHDHTTGLVRGLLCQGCNNGLGIYQDSIYTIVRAAVYLIISKIKGWFK